MAPPTVGCIALSVVAVLATVSIVWVSSSSETLGDVKHALKHEVVSTRDIKAHLLALDAAVMQLGGVVNHTLSSSIVGAGVPKPPTTSSPTAQPTTPSPTTPSPTLLPTARPTAAPLCDASIYCPQYPPGPCLAYRCTIIPVNQYLCTIIQTSPNCVPPTATPTSTPTSSPTSSPSVSSEVTQLYTQLALLSASVDDASTDVIELQDQLTDLTSRTVNGADDIATFNELFDRVVITLWHLGHSAVLGNYLALYKAAAPSVTDYENRRADIMARIYLDPVEPVLGDRIASAAAAYLQLDAHLFSLNRIRNESLVAGNDQQVRALDAMEHIIKTALVWRHSKYGNICWYYYEGFVDLLSDSFVSDVLPFMGFRDSSRPIDPDQMPNLLDKDLADYSVRDYQIVLSFMQHEVRHQDHLFAAVDHGMRTGYRPLGESITSIRDSLGYEPVWKATWVDSPYQGLPTDTPEKQELKSEIELAFTAQATRRAAIWDRITVEYRYTNSSQLTLQTLNGLYPYIWPAIDARANEPVIRSRYAVPATLPNGLYQNLAGMPGMYPTGSEAADDYARAWATMVDSRVGPTEAAQTLLTAIDNLNASPTYGQRVAFVSRFFSLYKPAHAAWVAANGHWQTNNYVDAAQTVRNQNSAGYQLRNLLNYQEQGMGGGQRVISVTNGVISLHDAHELRVGDSFHLVEPSLDNTDAVVEAYNLYAPSRTAAGCFVFNSSVPFVVGELVNVRDYGVGLFTSSRTSIGTTGLLIAAAGTYWVDMRDPNFKMFPESNTATRRYQRLRGILVTSVTLNAPLAGETKVCLSGVAPVDLDLQSKGQLVRISRVQPQLQVTAVLDDYTVLVNNTLTLTGAQTTGDRLFIQHTLATRERILIARSIDIFGRIFDELGSVLSEKQLARVSIGSVGIRRSSATATGISASNATMNYGAPVSGTRPWGNLVGTIIHEVFGHVLHGLNTAQADRSGRTVEEITFDSPTTFVEGQANYMEQVVPVIMGGLLIAPERTVLAFTGTAGRIHFRNLNPSDRSASLRINDTVVIATFDTTSRNVLRDTVGVAYVVGATDFISRTYRIVAKGSAGTIGSLSLSYLDLVDPQTGLPAVFAAHGVGSPLPLGYVISQSGIRLLDAPMWSVEASTYVLGICYGDIAVNYLQANATNIEAVYQSISATNSRNTFQPTQHTTYGWGYLAIDAMVRTYQTALGITQQQFYADGHIKGFLDMFNLDGTLDQRSRYRRLDEFIAYAKAGGDVTRYYAGQEQSSSSASLTSLEELLAVPRYRQRPPAYEEEDEADAEEEVIDENA